MYKGDPENWQVLDKSFSSENRLKAQMMIRDVAVAYSQKLNENLVNPKNNEVKIKNDKIPCPVKTNYID